METVHRLTRKELSELFVSYIETTAELIGTSAMFVPTTYAIFTPKTGKKKYVMESVGEELIHNAFTGQSFKSIAQWLETRRPISDYNLEMIMCCAVAERLTPDESGVKPKCVLFAAQDHVGAMVFEFYQGVEDLGSRSFERVDMMASQNEWYMVSAPAGDSSFRHTLLDGIWREYSLVTTIDKALAASIL